MQVGEQTVMLFLDLVSAAVNERIGDFPAIRRWLPFVGAGTIAAAAERKGKGFIGSEISKENYDPAISRMSQETAAWRKSGLLRIIVPVGS